jgi:TatA/E family protein of Tat protein translocase
MIIFGAGKLPEVGRSLGAGIRELKSSLSDNHMDNQAQGAIEEKSKAGA